MALTAVLGGVGFAIARFTPAMSALIWAMLLGAALANTMALPAIITRGAAFAAKQILRLAVGILGFRLAASQMLAVGGRGAALIVVAVLATFFLTVWLGQRLGLSRRLAIVLGAGSSICGAAACVAVAEVVDAEDEEIAVGVGAVTLFGTVSMLLYPLVGAALGMSGRTFGLWAGASIHEVAQVVAAAFSFDAMAKGTSAIEIATVVKLGRVLMLAPVALGLSLIARRSRGRGGRKVALIPWFIVLFLATFAVRSSGLLRPSSITLIVQGDTFLLATAMAGLGLDLRWAKLRAAGVRPLYLTAVASLFIATIAFALVHATMKPGTDGRPAATRAAARISRRA